MVGDRREASANRLDNVLARVKQGCGLTIKERKSLVELFADLLRPYGIPSTPLHEVLHEAAKRAGWTPPSPKAQHRQQVAANGRTRQREEDLAIRRILVSYEFKTLPTRLRSKPSSTGTAQAIIGRLEELPFERKPPMTVRTIQEDIRYMRKNGNFGI
jgi:hypothetical protein